METKKLKVNCVIAIDPGASNGGICVYRPGYKLECVRMPKDLRQLRDFIEYYKGFTHPIVFVEKLSIRPDDMVTSTGENRGKVFRIQKMLANFEQIKTVLDVLDVPFVLVHPIKWQSGLKLRIKGAHEEKSARKARYKQVAKELYPLTNVTLWNSDAILIMHYGRYVLQNDLDWVLQNVPQRAKGFLF